MDLRRNLNMPMTSIDTNARKDWVALHHWELQPTSANLPAGWLTNCTIRSPRATNLFCFPGFSNLMSVPKNYGSWQGLQFILCKIQALAKLQNPGMTLCLLAVAQTGFEEPSQKPEQRPLTYESPFTFPSSFIRHRRHS